MKYFYCRVSSKDQNLERQLDVAREYEPDGIFCDKMSGKDFHRPEYERLKGVVKEGDIVYVKELDRLGRNKEGVKEEIRWFQRRGVILRILDIPTTLIDFGDQTWICDMVTNILIEVLGAVAEQERIKIKKRQREGIEAMPVIDGKKVSKKTGRATGRPQKCDSEKILELKRRGCNVEEGCKILGISRATWYNKVKAV